MATKRPEGLSPAFGSLVSPSIPNSMTFEWEFRAAGANDYQTEAEVEFYEDGLLADRTLTTSQGLHISTTGLMMVDGATYEWRVRTKNQLNEWSQWSDTVHFMYGAIDQGLALSWMETAQSGQEVRRDEALAEIRDNILVLISDYIGSGSDVAEEVAIDEVVTMFTGKVVPSRNDFDIMKRAINMIATQKEVMSPFEVIGPIRDGLGARDIQVIRGFLQAIQMNPPQAPRNISIEIDPTDIQAITMVQGETEGALDKDVTVTWEWEDYVPSTGRVRFNSLSSSEDVSYYRVVLNYGIDGSGIDHSLYFRREDIEQMGGYMTFYTDWPSIFDKTNITSSKHRVSVQAFDRRGNASTWYNVVRQHTGMVPLGRWYQEVQYQRDTDPSTTWWKVDGKTVFYGNTYNHELGDKKFKVRYRVRTIDKNGGASPWVNSEWVDFLGLVPPGPPRDLKITNITHEGFRAIWNAGTNATNYQIKIMSTGVAYYTGGARSYDNSNRKANTKYWFYVRSTNSIGVSAWVSTTFTTKPEPTTTKTYSFNGGDSWRTSYKSYSSMVPGGWRTENNWVYQGRWEYLQNTYDDWNMDGRDEQVYKGMHNGNHKGLWFIDYMQLRRDVGSKTIKKAEIYIQRASTEHGYPNDANPVYLWLHNYASRPSGEPTIFNEYVSGVKLDRGQGRWITIPNWMMQKIVNGDARGFAVHKKTIGVRNDVSYQYFSQKIQLRITYG